MILQAWITKFSVIYIRPINKLLSCDLLYMYNIPQEVPWDITKYQPYV